MAHTSELLYPCFIECCKYTDDIYWKFIFEDLAYGKTPYGVYFSKDFLCCNFKNKEFTYKVETKKSAKLLYEEIYNVLHNKFGLLSKQDQIMQKKMFENTQEELQNRNHDWKSIKKKSIKQNLIEKYAIDMKKKHKLSNKKMKRLFSLIVLGLIFKTITIDQIVYKNGSIHKIIGISYKNGDFSFAPVEKTEKSSQPEIILDQNTMATHWPKYLKTTQKF